MTDRSAPRAEYLRRLGIHQTAAARGARDDNRLANLRLLVFLVGLVLAGFSLYRDPHTAVAVALIALVAFGALVVAHARVLNLKARSDGIVRHYQTALRRLNGQWVGQGRQGQEFAPTEHVYANDLDLFGEGSLFERLCTARTHAGETTLAQWLCEPAPPDEIRRRHEAIEDLRGKLDLREDLALFGEDVREKTRPRSLAQWVAQPATLDRRRLRPASFAMTGLTLAAAALSGFTGLLAPVLLMLAAELIFSSYQKARVAAVDAAAQDMDRDLSVLTQVLARLERETFQAPMLVELQQALREGRRPASRRIRQLDRLVDLMEIRHNFVLGPLAFVLMWGPHFAMNIESWRDRWGRHVPRWLEAVGQLEALSALAAYTFDNPEDPFPEMIEGTPRFEASDLGHPLLTVDTCVRNDLRLGADTRLLVVSGSNMSGKSTLLRTVGVNVVLAQAGAPVRARSLRLSPLAVGATLRVLDSMRQGTSRFYAEILRLRHMLDATRGTTPVLFLLDEILHGTNSHDREIGADAVVKAFLGAGAIGLITTHDLAVTHVVETLGGRAANVHFSDHFENGHLTFDYKLQPGVVSQGNALRLMQSLGLPV